MNKPLMKEFELGEIFKITNGGRVKKHDQVKGSIPYVTATTNNNGIDSYISNPLFTQENIITVTFLGDVYYHPYIVAYKDGTYGLEFKGIINDNVMLYLVTVIYKTTINLGSYSKMIKKDDLVNLKIKLPVKSLEDTEPDYEYMENFIKEVQNKVVELKIKEDQEEMKRLKTLIETASYKELDDVMMKKFKLGDMFKIKPSKYYNEYKSDDYLNLKGQTPLISNTSLNNGIKHHVNLKPLNEGNCITASDTTTVDATFYQKKDFVGYSHIQCFISNYDNFNQNIAHYIIAVLRKTVFGMYDYGTKFNRSVMNKTEIELPVKSLEDTEPDYEYMDQYIQNMQLKYINEKHKANMEYIEQIKQIIKMTNQPKAS